MNDNNTTLGQIASSKWQRFCLMLNEDDFAHNLNLVRCSLASATAVFY